MKSKRILFGLFLLALAKSVLFSHFGFGLVDEGESLHNAQRILTGDLPYRDFFAIFPPLDNYLYAIVLWIFGESVVIPRIVTSSIFAFVPLLLFLIGRRFMPSLYALLPALLIIFLDVNIERLYFFAPVLAGFYLFLENKFFLSGLLFGLSSLVRLDLPGTFLFGALAGLGLHYWNSEKKGWIKTWFVGSLKTGFGYAVPVVIILFWLIKQGIFSSFWEQTFVQSIVITNLHSLPFPPVSDLVPQTLGLFEFNRAYTALYAYLLLSTYLIAGVLLIKNRKTILQSTPEVAMLVFSGLAALPYIFGRTEIGHMVKGGIPFLFLGSYLLYQAHRRFSFWFNTTAASRITRVSVLGDEAPSRRKRDSTATYRRKPQASALGEGVISVLWALVFAIFLANVVQSVWWIKFNDEEITIRGYKLRLNGNYAAGSTIPSAKTVEKAVQFVRENTEEKEPVLLLPYMAGVYFLTDRPSPTEFNNVLAGFINSKEGESEFIKKVEESGIRVVVYDPENGPKMKTRRLQDYNPLIHNYLMEKFEVIEETQEGWLLMRRRNE